MNSFTMAAGCGVRWASIAYDPDRDLLWVNKWPGDGFCGLDPNTGALVRGAFPMVTAPSVQSIYGSGLAYTHGKLIQNTETGNPDGFHIWDICN